MSKRSKIDAFLSNFMTDYKYSYVTIKKFKTQDVLCEGFAWSLNNTVNISSLKVRSFNVFEAEDGGVFVDIYI